MMRKNLQNKFLLLLFVLAIPFEVSHASASIADVHYMVDICVNLHRIQKDFSLVGMGVRYDNPSADLTATIKKIDKEFASLFNKHHLGETLEKQIHGLEEEWKVIRAITTATPSKKQMLTLHKATETATDHCMEAADLLASDAHTEGEKYVVEAAEMGMESQRLAALYLMRTWGIENKNYYTEVKHVLEEFEKFYHDLKKVDEKFVSAEAKAKLEDVDKEFLVFVHLAESKTGRFTPALAQRSANNLFDHINEITQLIMDKVEH